MVTMRRAVAATSVFIGLAAARFNPEQFADFEWGVSVITLGELRLGILQARDPEPPRSGCPRTSSPNGSSR
jgi:predicted nucleic acid-binding protein